MHSYPKKNLLQILYLQTKSDFTNSISKFIGNKIGKVAKVFDLDIRT